MGPARAPCPDLIATFLPSKGENPMIISVINHTDGRITDEEVQRAVRAINQQIADDFEPYWSLGATLRLEGKSSLTPQKQTPADMRGDAVIYLWDKTDVPNAL